MKTSLSLGFAAAVLVLLCACGDSSADPPGKQPVPPVRAEDQQPAPNQPAGESDPKETSGLVLLPLCEFPMPGARDWLDADSQLHLFRSEEEVEAAAGARYAYTAVDFEQQTLLAIHLTADKGIGTVIYTLTQEGDKYAFLVKISLLDSFEMGHRVVTLLCPKLPTDAAVELRIEYGAGYDLPADQAGVLPLSSVGALGPGRWMEADNRLRIYRSAEEWRADAEAGYIDRGFDFDRYTLLTLHLCTPNGIRYVTYSLTKDDDGYAFRADAKLFETDDIGYRFLALLAPKIQDGEEVRSQVALSY